jgi:hypothetical protein
MTTTFLYFAYGSNMSAPRLRARTPSAEPIGAAKLPGFRLVFDKWGRDDSAKADCEHTDAPDHVVHGGLFAFTRRTARRWTAQKVWARVTTPRRWL